MQNRQLVGVPLRTEGQQAYEAAFERSAEVLRGGDVLALFLGGGIAHEGTLQPFKSGVVKILERAQADGLDVPVVPMALTKLWG